MIDVKIEPVHKQSKQARRRIYRRGRSMLQNIDQITLLIMGGCFGASPDYRYDQALNFYQAAESNLKQMDLELNKVKAMITEFKRTAHRHWPDEVEHRSEWKTRQVVNDPNEFKALVE